MTIDSTLPAKRYRGSSAEERRAERRDKLICAAVEVYGERGYRDATVKAVCEAAGLTERYFYEGFANSEALLAAAFDEVSGGLLDKIEQAGQAIGAPGETRVAAMLGAYFEALRREPTAARVFLVEIGGVSAEVDQALDAALKRFTGLLEAGWGASGAPALVRAGIAGALVQIAIAWIAERYGEPVETVTAAALRISAVLKTA